jgi:signal transduction histidine kinase
VLLLRTSLLDDLDSEVEQSLLREAEEFLRLSRGDDPRTGRPLEGDVQALFDAYFAREVPDEGETLLAFLDGELYEARRSQDAAAVDELGPAARYWLGLEEREVGSLDTPTGEAHYVALPLTGTDADGLFVVANFPAFEREEIEAAVRAQILAQLTAITGASLLALALAGRILRPLRELASTARQISDTDLSRRIPVSRRDEASQIAAAFNDMLGRLENAFTSQREFLHDTSHELRTPLTVIRGHVELLDLDVTPEERAETVALVLDEVDRMNRIVHDLFLLARADQPDFLQLRPVDLCQVVQTVWRRAGALADRDWRFRSDGEVPAVADDQRLVQALLQLADNATRYTGPGQVIEFGVSGDGAGGRMWVRDEGRGVPPEVAAHVFRRRQQGADGVPSTGAGLGLAIVDAIARAHGGGVRLVEHTGPGAWFEVTVPHRPPRRSGSTASGRRDAGHG